MSSSATWDKVDRYFDSVLSLSDAALDSALASSKAGGLPDIQVAPNQAMLLHVLAKSIGARRILEIGTLGGYSAIWLGRALPPGDSGARVVTLERMADHASVARQNLERAGLQDRVEVRVGAALDLLPQVAASGIGPFDLIFVDADKENNPNYFDWAMRLARPGGLIVFDNVVRDGEVANADSTSPQVRGTRALFDRIAAEPRAMATAIQTVGVKGYDGLALIWVRPREPA
jgi:predicted O-methyltransferase YrrM